MSPHRPAQDLHVGRRQRPGTEAVEDQEDGEQPLGFNPAPLREIRRGNLALGSDCLVVADRKELTVYAAAASAPPERGPEARTGTPQARYGTGIAPAVASAPETRRVIDVESRPPFAR